MGAYIKKRWALLLALCVFIALKIPHLHYAFYGDESWVYAPSIFLMHAHGPSLLPGAIPLEYSRGHPMLFQAGCATWMNIFGTSNFSMHCFALFISIWLAIALYEILLTMFGQRTAMIGIVLLIFNKAYFTESSFVMTDIMLTMLAFLSLYLYTKEQYVLTSLSLALLLLTKESGIVAGVVICGDMALKIIRKEVATKDALYRCSILALSLVPVLIFFAYQKKEYGWYLYPEHTNLINLNIENTLYNIQRSITIFFINEQDHYFFFILLILCALAAWKQKKIKYTLLFLPALLVWALAEIFSYKDVIFYAAALLFVIFSIVFLAKRHRYFCLQQEKFIKLNVAFGIAYLYFCCVNFFEGRYLIPVIFLLSVVLCSILYGFFISKSWHKLFPYVLVVIACTGFYIIGDKGVELEVYDRTDVHQNVVDFFENNKLYDKRIYSGAYLERVHLTDVKTGFLRRKVVFSHVYNTQDKQTEIFIFDNIESDNDAHMQIKKDSTSYLVYSYHKGYQWAEVYMKK